MSGRPAVGGPVPAAGAVVFDETGRLLLVRRGREPERGRWSVPGGKVEPGETFAQAAARETLEETGLLVDIGRELWVATVPVGDGQVFEIHDFLATSIGGTLLAGDDADDVRWVPVDDVRSLPLTSALAEHLDRAGLIPPSPGGSAAGRD